MINSTVSNSRALQREGELLDKLISFQSYGKTRRFSNLHDINKKALKKPDMKRDNLWNRQVQDTGLVGCHSACAV